MALPHGHIQLKPRTIQIQKEDQSFEASLFLPPDPRGAVIFGGLCQTEAGMTSLLLDALIDAGLSVIMLPPLSRRRQTERLSQMLRAARVWLYEQDWAETISQGLLGCGPMGCQVLDLAGWPENLLHAVAVFEGAPEMSETDVGAVQVPTLFATSEEHPDEEELNREMALCMRCECRVVVLDRVRTHPRVVADWFVDHFESNTRARQDDPVFMGEARAFPVLASSF